MALGSLTVDITDLRDRALSGTLHVDFAPHSSSQGGERLEADFDVDGHETFTVTGIACHSGIGTLYTVRFSVSGYKPYAFFQMIRSGVNRPSEARIRLMVNPKKVRDIVAPTFADLPATFQTSLSNAAMARLADEDADLVGKQGEALYRALGPLRQACLLNLVAKGLHPSTDGVARLVEVPTVMRQDRCFARVDPTMPDVLRASDRFKSAPSLLHKPPKGFVRLDSFKSRDAHANLQVTFMQEQASKVVWADIDIDEAAGVEHGFEVVRNTVVDGRTNPFLVRELLLLASPEAPIDPGYDFQLR